MANANRSVRRTLARTLLLAALAVLLSSAGPATATNAGYVYVWQGSQMGARDYGDFYVVNNTGYELYVSGSITGASVPGGLAQIDPYGVYGFPDVNLKQANSGDIRVQVLAPGGTHIIDILAKKVENDYTVWNLTPSGTPFTQTLDLQTDASGACSYGFHDSTSQYYTPDLVVGLHAKVGSDDGKTFTLTKVILMINPNRSGSVYTRCNIF